MRVGCRLVSRTATAERKHHGSSATQTDGLCRYRTSAHAASRALMPMTGHRWHCKADLPKDTRSCLQRGRWLVGLARTGGRRDSAAPGGCRRADHRYGRYARFALVATLPVSSTTASHGVAPPRGARRTEELMEEGRPWIRRVRRRPGRRRGNSGFAPSTALWCRHGLSRRHAHPGQLGGVVARG